jgi:ABC-type branched-subunit amino acid transport system ATPase component
LAPVVVQELLGMIAQLKAAGMTIVIVEQSLNVALSIADRAVFMEKGQVRFAGPARDLLERDDLARAVFLGQEGG